MVLAGSDREEESAVVCEGALGAKSSSSVQIEEHASQAATVETPNSAAELDRTQEVALQQQGQFLLLLAAVLLVGLVMLLPELSAYLSRMQSSTMLTSTLI